MNKVYAIVKTVVGPAGHGEPGESYLSLATENNDYYKHGTPRPVFTSIEKAEEARKVFDQYSEYQIISITLGD